MTESIDFDLPVSPSSASDVTTENPELEDKTSKTAASSKRPNPRRRKKIKATATTAVVGAAVDIDASDLEGWTTVFRSRGSAPVPVLMKQKTAARKNFLFLEQRMRLKSHFPFLTHTFHDVRVPLKIGEASGDVLFGTVTIKDCPKYSKEKGNPVPCWERKPVNGVRNFCTMEWKIIKIKGKDKPMPTFTLCKNHMESKELPSKAATTLAMKQAKDAVEFLQDEIELRREKLHAKFKLKAKDNFEKQVTEWEIPELGLALETWFMQGMYIFAEIPAIPQLELNSVTINNNFYTREYFSFNHDLEVRQWNNIINALSYFLWATRGIRIYLSYPYVKRAFFDEKAGGKFADEFISEVMGRDDYNKKFSYTLSKESFEENGNCLIPDRRVHIKNEKSIKFYVSRPLAEWGDVHVETEDAKINFHSACLTKIETLVNSPPYSIFSGAHNKKFALKIREEDRVYFNSLNSQFIKWRAANPSLVFSYLGMMGKVTYIDRSGDLRLNKTAVEEVVFPSAGGGKDPIKPEQGQASVVPAKSGNDATKTAQQDKKKRTKTPKKQYVIKGSMGPALPAPDPKKETSSIQQAPKNPVSTYYECKGKKFRTKFLGANWTYAIAGTGWCGMDTIIYFLEAKYPTIFAGVALTYKREMVTFYARLCSDYAGQPDFEKSMIEDEHWMTNYSVIQTLHAFGFDAQLYTPIAVGDYDDMKFNHFASTPSYQNPKFVTRAPVFYNGSHFEPMDWSKCSSHVAADSKPDIALDDYLLVRGEKYIKKNLWTLRPKTKQIIAHFIAEALNDAGPFKYVAQRQYAVLHCWHISNAQTIQVYRYADIEDDDVRTLMTGEQHDLEQSLILKKMRINEKLKPVLETPDFFISPLVEGDDSINLLKKIDEHEKPYVFKTVSGKQIVEPIKFKTEEECWSDVVTDLIRKSTQVGASAVNAEKTPKTKDDEATYYLTEEEYEAKKRKTKEKYEAKQKEYAATLEFNLEQFKCEFDTKLKEAIENKDKEIEAMSTEQKEQFAKAIKKHEKVKEELISSRSLIQELENQIKVNKLVEEKLKTTSSEELSFLRRVLNFLLSLLGFSRAAGSGGGHPYMDLEYMKFKLGSWKMNFQRRLKASPQEVKIETIPETVRSKWSPKGLYYRAAKALPNPIQITKATVNFVDKAAVQLSDFLETPDNVIRCDLRTTGLNFNWANTANAFGMSWGAILTGRVGFVKVQNKYGFRLQRTVALEYDNNNKELTVVNEHKECISFGRFGFTVAGRYNSIFTRRNANALTAVNESEEGDKQWNHKPLSVAQFIQNITAKPTETKGGGATPLAKFALNTILSSFGSFIVDNKWKMLSIPVGAGVNKIPSSIIKPFRWNDNAQSVHNVHSNSLTMVNFQGKEVLADWWEEQNNSPTLVQLNNLTKNTVVPPRLNNRSKTLVDPTFRVVTHNTWERQMLTPGMQVIRTILKGIDTVNVVPPVVLITASMFFPWKHTWILSLLNTLGQMADNLLFTIDYVVIKHNHVVSIGVINEMNIKGPTVSDPGDKQYMEQRAAVQHSAATWYSNMRMTSVMQSNLRLFCAANNAPANWMSSTSMYAVVFFDTNASSAHAMVRRC